MDAMVVIILNFLTHRFRAVVIKLFFSCTDEAFAREHHSRD